jgi:hypothetical protein
MQITGHLRAIVPAPENLTGLASHVENAKIASITGDISGNTD